MNKVNKPRIFGMIPARGGSKGVLRKNIRLVAGKPLIAYTVEAANESHILTRFITSTDDTEIAEVAKNYGSDVLIRPPELAADDTPMLSVILHVLRTIESEVDYFDYVAILQPTAPMRLAADIDGALTLLFHPEVDSIVSVYQVSDNHPSRMYRLQDGYLVPYDAEPDNHLRQSLPPVYHRNGAIYACTKRLLLDQGLLIGDKAKPYLMPKERSINIDDELDLKFADFLLREKRKLELGN